MRYVLILLGIWVLPFTADTQLLDLCDFETPVIGVDTFAADFSSTAGFTCNDAVFFPNEYTTDFGGQWLGGWAISSRGDTLTGNESNLFSAITGSGASAINLNQPNAGTSSQYAIGQQEAYILTPGFPYIPSSIAITNTTFTYQTLLMGSDDAKPLGGLDGTDPDFFLLTINGYAEGVETTEEAIEFFLADYRFLDDRLDYIVADWQQVLLFDLGFPDSITFTLTSSDIGEFGINHPPYFAVDNLQMELFTATDEAVESATTLQVFPNPVTDILRVESSFAAQHISIFDNCGRLVKTVAAPSKRAVIPVADLPNGIYFIRTENAEHRRTERFVKL